MIASGMTLISLNPYSNGRYSMRLWERDLTEMPSVGLNPYSNGRYSMSIDKDALVAEIERS